MLRIINAEDHKVAEAVAGEIPAIARAVDAIVAAFRRGGRLFYIGAGTSGSLGVLDASECPPTFGVPPEMVQGIIAGGERGAHPRHRGDRRRSRDRRARSAARGFTAADMLAGIAASGRTPYVLGAVAEARRLGAVTIGISCTPDSELARARRDRHHAAGRPRSNRRIDAPEGRHRHETGTQHALYRGVHPAWATFTAT